MRAFKKGERPAIWWPVQVDEAADGGKVESFEFQAKIRPMTPREMREMPSNEGGIVEVILDRVTDWDKVTDPDTGEKIAFDREVLADALDNSAELLRGLERALVEVSSGGGERKNSRTSRGR